MIILKPASTGPSFLLSNMKMGQACFVNQDSLLKLVITKAVEVGGNSFLMALKLPWRPALRKHAINILIRENDGRYGLSLDIFDCIPMRPVSERVRTRILRLPHARVVLVHSFPRGCETVSIIRC